MAAKAVTMVGQPAFRGSAFAVLLLLPILRRDACGFQAEHPGLARRHQYRGDRCMGIVRLAVLHLDAAAPTVNLGRGAERRAIQRAQPVGRKTLVGLQGAGLRQPPKEHPERRRELGGRNGVQQVANLRITGHRPQAKPAGRVVAPFLALHIPLMRQKRRRLHEEYRKGGHTGVPQRVGQMRPGPLIRQTVKLTAQ